MAENGDTLSLEYTTCFKKIFSLFYISKQQNIHLWSFFVLYFLNILVENGDWFKSKQYFTKKSSQLRNIFVNFKQRNLKKHLKVRETLLEKFKENWKTLLANLDIKNRFDNRRFWKTVESLFSDKLMHKEIINLIKKKKNTKNTSANDKDAADAFSKYFGNIVSVSVPSQKLSISNHSLLSFNIFSKGYKGFCRDHSK